LQAHMDVLVAGPENKLWRQARGRWPRPILSSGSDTSTCPHPRAFARDLPRCAIAWKGRCRVESTFLPDSQLARWPLDRPLGASAPILDKPNRIQRRLDFLVRHEQLPDEPSAMVLDHHRDRCLIERHIGFFEPVLRFVEAVVKTVNAPDLRTQVAVE